MELCPIDLLTSPWVCTHLWACLCVCVCVCLCVWLVFLTHGQTKRSAWRGRTPLKRIWSRCFSGLSLTSFHQLSTSSFPSSFSLMDAEWFALVLWKPVGLADYTDAGKQSRPLTLRGRIRRQLVLLASALPYMFVPACHMCSLSLSLSLFLFLFTSLTRQSEKQPQGEWHLGPEVHQCHLNQTFEIYVCGHIYRSFRFRGFLFFIWHVSDPFWGSESECALKSSLCRFTVSPSLCLYASQGRERLCQWGIKSRYPRYPHQSACYYFIRLISGCLTPPSFSPVRPSAAEFLISAKTMVCLSCCTK